MNLYQIQAKFRDEPRPRGGLLRWREFLMKDAYSFDVSEEAARASYEKMREAYCAHLRSPRAHVPRGRGRPGRHRRHDERRVPGARRLGRGRDRRLRHCDYAANVEIATVRSPPRPRSADAPRTSREGPHAEGRHIEDVSAFLKPPEGQVPQVARLPRRTRSSSWPSCAATTTSTRSSSRARSASTRCSWRPTPTSRRHRRQGRLRRPRRLQGQDRRRSRRGAGEERGDRRQRGRPALHGREPRARLAGRGRRPAPRDDGRRAARAARAASSRAYRGIEVGHIFILGTRYSAQMGAQYSTRSRRRSRS